MTYDSTVDNVFHVHKHDKILKFREATRRLYYFDTYARFEDFDVEVSDSEGTVLINTVEENASRFSAYDFNKAQQARQLQCRIGRPSTAHFIHIMKNNQIPNCPVTVRDIQNAEYIWGKELGSIKRKTVRRQAPAVRTEVYNIPVPLMQKYQHVTLSVDLMFIAKIPFLMTISRHIKSVRPENWTNRTTQDNSQSFQGCNCSVCHSRIQGYNCARRRAIRIHAW